MQIRVNGRPTVLNEGQTIAALLCVLNLDPKWVLVERNGLPVEKHRFDNTVLAAEDIVEVVRMVGGG